MKGVEQGLPVLGLGIDIFSKGGLTFLDAIASHFGALRPIHCIILKAFAMALGDRTKCKTCCGCPRMVLCGP